MSKLVAILILLVLATVCAMRGEAQVVGGSSSKLQSLSIVSAGPEIAQSRIASDLSAALTSATLRVLPIIGKGPIQNAAEILDFRSADSAIVQSDILAYLLSKGGRPSLYANSLRYVAPLYDEDVHVLAREEITQIKLLEGQTVGFGPRDGGAHVTSSLLFSILNINVVPLFADFEAALDKLRRGEIAALVYVAKKPARLFFDLNRTDHVHFLPVPLTPQLARIYRASRLTISDYPLLIGEGEAGRGEAISTIAVPLVLAVYNWPVGTGRYYTLSKFVESFRATGVDALRRRSGDPIWVTLNPDDAVPGWLRFEPAEQNLNGTSALAGSATNVPSLRPRPNRFQTQPAPNGPVREDDLFEKFLLWTNSEEGAVSGADSLHRDFNTFLLTTPSEAKLTSAERELLFERFLRWQNSEAERKAQLFEAGHPRQSQPAH